MDVFFDGSVAAIERYTGSNMADRPRRRRRWPSVRTVFQMERSSGTARQGRP